MEHKRYYSKKERVLNEFYAHLIATFKHAFISWHVWTMKPQARAFLHRASGLKQGQQYWNSSSNGAATEYTR